MTRFRLAAAVLAVAAGLAACDDPDDPPRGGNAGGSIRYASGDGAIQLDGDRVIIVAGGQAGRAAIDVDGSLAIDGEPVSLSEAGRSALRDYDAAAVALKRHAIEIGRTGAEFGVDVLKDVVGGFIDDRLDEVGDRARAGARDLVASLRDLCQRLDTVHAAQTRAAAAVPAFAPYAVLDAEQVRDCYREVDEEAAERADEAPVPAPTAPAT